MARPARFKPGDRVDLSTRRYELVRYLPDTDTWSAVDLEAQRGIEIAATVLEEFGEAVK